MSLVNLEPYGTHMKIFGFIGGQKHKVTKVFEATLHFDKFATLSKTEQANHFQLWDPSRRWTQMKYGYLISTHS